MSIESANYISQLDITNPPGTDQYSTLDDQIRLCKKAVRQTLPNLNSEVSATAGALNKLVGITQNVQDALNSHASSIAALSASFNTDIRGVSSSLKSQLNTTSSNLDTKIETLSSSMRTQLSDTSSTLDTKVETLSSTMNTDIRGLSSTLQTAKLGVSATAVNAILWDGSAKYVQTATPALATGEIWFQPSSYTP